MKYKAEINMLTENSLSNILKNIKPNSKVLEFGSANGYCTRYLKEILNCSVNIVEYDAEAGFEAASFADDALVGPEEGDATNLMWHKEWQAEKFDYILFADILEHLLDPFKVINAAKDLLADSGSIFISIPNVSHNSIIIDLINNNFEYRELGLLDNTHIKLFARKNLIKMIEYTGLRVVQEINTFLSPENTEFVTDINLISTELKTILEARPDGNLYQFVWELKI